MSPNTSPSLSELKVGIFVVVAGGLLALAILTIGSDVGLLEEKFTAVTYLNNVGGLKRGDIVLLGGVEVGNVTEIRIIDEPGQFPSTDQNTLTQQRLQELESRRQPLVDRVTTTQTALDDAQNRLQEATASGAPTDALQRSVTELTNQLATRTAAVTSLEEEMTRIRRDFQNIRIKMQLRSNYRDWIRRDSGISLGSSGLLGDRTIEISLGRTSDPPLIDEIDEEEVVVITGVQQAGFQELITSTNDILGTFSSLSNKIDDIMNKVEVGDGTIGRILNDPSIYENLNTAVENAGRTMEQAALVMEQLSQGDGTIPSLIRQREVYDRILAATEQLESVANRINSGEGTLGKFINDPSIYDRADELVANIEKITQRMEAGEGTLGKLSTDEQVYANLRDSLEELRSILKSVQAGEGTLGKLASDEELYNNINQVSAEMVKLLYDFRQDPKKFLTIKFEIF